MILILITLTPGALLCEEPPQHCVAPTREEEESDETADFTSLSDPQLAEQLADIISKKDFRANPDYETCLIALVRNGTSQSTAILRKHFNALMQRKLARYEGQENPDPGSYCNLELLTALRRIEKRPDPLRIVVETQKGMIAAKTLSLPAIKVRITNVDVEKQDVGFTSGGDYRSGRQARWRLQTADEKGVVVPSRPRRGYMLGGQSIETVLKYGESWETILNSRDFIATPPPGRYQLQVLYHDTRTISDMDNVAGLIVSKSATVQLVIKPTVIVLTSADAHLARSLVARLPPAEQLKIVVGSYGPWAHSFVYPNSPQGKLLNMGLKAVPQLIESLQHDKLSLRTKACVLSILFSITGENDPRECTGLGEYDYLEGPWMVFGGQSGGPESGGIGFPVVGSSSWGKLDPTALQQLATGWAQWLTSGLVKAEQRQDTKDSRSRVHRHLPCRLQKSALRIRRWSRGRSGR